MTIAPIVHSVRVAVAPAQAFELFTSHMGRWFPHGIGKAPKVDVVVEPRPQGRWYERDAEGVETEWGRVLAWEPPSRVLFAWQITAASWAFDPNITSEVEVRFEPAEDGGTLVTLEHRKLESLGADAPYAAERFRNGWPGVLEQFVRYADGRA